MNPQAKAVLNKTFFSGAERRKKLLQLQGRVLSHDFSNNRAKLLNLL